MVRIGFGTLLGFKHAVAGVGVSERDPCRYGGDCAFRTTLSLTEDTRKKNLVFSHSTCLPTPTSDNGKFMKSDFLYLGLLQKNRITYTGNNATVQFPVSFTES